MVEPQNGFTQEQLVIYKLGQIESQLASFLVKLTDNNIEINKDLLDHDTRISKNAAEIDKLKNQVNTWIARLIGGAAVISAIVAYSKGFVEKWLNLS